MAIKFVDVEPEDAGKAEKAKAVRDAPKPDTGVPDATVRPELPHAKPEPKPRGRKKPLR